MYAGGRTGCALADKDMGGRVGKRQGGTGTCEKERPRGGVNG
ncbi:protein of unknown function [Kyrpidia spormannii]|uniref:Uncharacterized protein n=1 Tax=Kyrpidia spormannii TaxID=2055160 RepID=A0A6F9E341_9BACL|nr:protein of unknown function [Kyrpidia spormannii]